MILLLLLFFILLLISILILIYPSIYIYTFIFVCMFFLFYLYLYLHYIVFYSILIIFCYIILFYSMFYFTILIMRIECKLRTIVQYHIIQHSKIHSQRAWHSPFRLKTHCSDRENNSNAEAGALVASSLEHPLWHWRLGHNRASNPRFAGYQP